MATEIINKHILKLKNVYYDKEFIVNEESRKNVDKFIDNYRFSNNENFDNKKIITIDNMFIHSTLCNCFCHALIDGVFPYFWAINDIKEHDSNFNNFLLFIRKKAIIKYPENSIYIDKNTGKYKGINNDLINLINNKYIFEHLIKNDTVYFVKNCYFYTLDSRWQRSPWNCIDYYSFTRDVKIKDVTFSDTEIKRQLKLFKESSLNKLFKDDSLNKSLKDNRKSIVLINRKSSDRNINRIKEKLCNILSKFDNFKGIIYLEDLTFKKQIEIFTDNNIIISPHGAGMIHNIWSSNNHIIEISFNPVQDIMYKRICDITDNKIYQIRYSRIVKILPILLDKIIR